MGNWVARLAFVGTLGDPLHLKLTLDYQQSVQ